MDKNKTTAGVFGLASLVGCAVTIWQVVSATSNPTWFTSLLVIIVATGLLGHYFYVRALLANAATEKLTSELIIREKDQEIEEILKQTEEVLATLFEQAGTWLHKIAHDIRDRTTELEWLKEKQKLSLDHLRMDAMATGRNIANYVEELFSYHLLETVAVSVKIIKRKANDQEVAITLCRSQHSASERKIGDEHVVGPENTAFHEIRTGQTTYYGKSDLIKEAGAGRYSNRNPKWPEQYKCAIVVPIRRKNLDFPDESDEEFLLIGFLCIDANEIQVFRDEDMDAHAQMLMAAADVLYKYLETVNQMEGEELVVTKQPLGVGQ
jgi:hypothetical protein